MFMAEASNLLQKFFIRVTVYSKIPDLHKKRRANGAFHLNDLFFFKFRFALAKFSAVVFLNAEQFPR